MSWAEVTKINSDMTLPINELLRNMVGLVGHKDFLLLSDLNSYDATEYGNKFYIYNKEYTINNNGSALVNIHVVFTAKPSYSTSYGNATVTAVVSKNGVEVLRGQIGQTDLPTNINAYLLENKEISFSKGDTLKIEVYSSLNTSTGLDYNITSAVELGLHALPVIIGFEPIKAR